MSVLDAPSPVTKSTLSSSISLEAPLIASAGFAFLVTLLFARRLEEPQAVSMEELLREVLIHSPLRFWFRLFPRGGT